MYALKIGTPIAALALLFAVAGVVKADGWGDIKGQVIWTGPANPVAKEIKVDKDQNHCLAKGALVSDELIVDGKTKGVKNVMVWLRPTQGKMPIHKDLAAVPKEKVVIDQPCCLFVPRITMMREGQILVVKNPSPILHNSMVTGDSQVNGTSNPSIPAGGEYAFEGGKLLKAEKKPMGLSCSVHGWMGGRIGVFDHPYYAVTKEDGTFEIKKAPAGKFLILILHERGWLHQPMPGKLPSFGQEITIKDGETLDLGKVQMNLNP